MPSRWVILAWANFALAVAAVLKFIPILVSLRHGLVLGDQRLWSLDLISDRSSRGWAISADIRFGVWI